MRPQEPTRAQKWVAADTRLPMQTDKSQERRSGADGALWGGRGHSHAHHWVGLKGSPYSRSLDTPKELCPLPKFLEPKTKGGTRIETCEDGILEPPCWRVWWTTVVRTQNGSGGDKRHWSPWEPGQANRRQKETFHGISGLSSCDVSLFSAIRIIVRDVGCFIREKTSRTSYRTSWWNEMARLMLSDPEVQPNKSSGTAWVNWGTSAPVIILKDRDTLAQSSCFSDCRKITS